MAYLWFPTFRRLSKHMPEGISAIIVLVLSTLVVIIPILFIFGMVISQAITLASSLADMSTGPGSILTSISTTVVTNINNFMAPIVGNSTFISIDSVTNFVQSVLPKVINSIVSSLMGILSNIPQMFTNTIVYFFLILAFLKYNKSLIRFVQTISPFGEGAIEKYAEKSGLIVTASLKGQFVISFVTAVSSALLFGICFGLWQYFIVLTIVFTLLGMVPLGSGIVVIPYTIIQMLAGDFWAGFWALLIYILVICNIDSVLRPHLIPKKANLIPAITVLATFCGIYYFGVFGVIYGPLIIVILMTTADIYRSTHQRKV